MFLKGRQGPYELLLPEVDVGLRFDPDDLPPMRPKVAADLAKGFEPDPTRQNTQLNFRAAVAINTDTGVRLEAPGDLDLPYCQIGSTGVVIAAQDLVFRLTAGTSLNATHPSLVRALQSLFDRDWKSPYATPI